MTDDVFFFRIGNNGYRYFSDPVKIDHIELTGMECIKIVVVTLYKADMQIENICCFMGTCQYFRFDWQIGIRKKTICHIFSLSFASPEMAANSSVRSMPTGHHEMQRPQPTQPLTSN